MAFERPDLRRGTHRIEVDLVDRSADVLTKREYVDCPPRARKARSVRAVRGTASARTGCG